MSNPGYPAVPGFVSRLDGSYTQTVMLSDQVNTTPFNVSVIGTPTPGDVLGFDYSFNYGGTHYVASIRHTYVAGETLLAVCVDWWTQFQANANINAALGPDIVSYAYVRRTSPTTGWFQFFQNMDIVAGGSAMAPVWTSSTASVGVSGGGGVLEINPYYAAGRSVLATHGRQPQAGDGLFGWYVSGDCTSVPADVRNVEPLYMQWTVRIKEPAAPGKGISQIMVDTLDLAVNSLTINGAPAGPIGIQGPQGVPGGNIAGSVVESPDFTITADAANPGTNFVRKQVYKLTGLGIAGWTTIATVTPSNVAGSWSIGSIEVKVEANTHGAGFGILQGDVYVSLANAAPTYNWIATPVSWGAAPQVRIIPSAGNSFALQIGSSDGIHAIGSGKATVTYSMSDAEGNPVTWTIN